MDGRPMRWELIALHVRLDRPAGVPNELIAIDPAIPNAGDASHCHRFRFGGAFPFAVSNSKLRPSPAAGDGSAASEDTRRSRRTVSPATG